MDSVCIIKQEPELEMHQNVHESIDIKQELEEITVMYTETEIKVEDLVPEEKVTNSVTCPICSKILSTEQSLKIHLWSHRGRMRYWCDICKKTLGSEFVYNRHMKLHETWKVTCDICGVTLPTRNFLIPHFRSHMNPQETKSTKPPLSCRICGEEFQRIVHLESHVTEIHPGEKTHSCNICKKTFTKITPLKMHMRIIHKGEFPFECDVCKKSFKYKQCLKMHLGRSHRRKKKDKNLK